jgi:hypothetical protein
MSKTNHFRRMLSWLVIGIFAFMIHVSATPMPKTRAGNSEDETIGSVAGSDLSTGAVEKPAKSKTKVEKKKFPWLLVAGGVVVIGVVLYLTVLKKSDYTLSVTVGNGISGTPASGENQYKKGTLVNYSYALAAGYTNLKVALDGASVAPSGSVTMNANHTLIASADSGLQLEWLLDGNAQDTSGYGRHGTVYNATLTADHKGAADRAYYFNGSNAYIEGPSFNAINNKSVSISFWYKAAGTTGISASILVGDGYVSSQDGNVVYYSISIPATSSASCPISMDAWTHIAGTYDGTTIRIYCNGMLKSSTTHIGTPDPYGRNFALGAFNGKYWKGSIDDVRVYNYTLSEAEIQALAGM